MSGREPFVTAAVYAGQGSSVSCFTYEAATPILAVSSPWMSVSISIAGRTQPVPAPVVEFARELAREAARFAAECERLHAAQAQAAQAGDLVPGDGRASAA